MTSSAPNSPDPGRRGRRIAWALQTLGLVVALAGLTGYWSTRDVERSQLSVSQRELLGVAAEDFTVSFVVAGRDRFYADCPGCSLPIYGAAGRIVGWRYTGPRSPDGANTDTVLYVQVVNDDVTIVALPRDLWMEGWNGRINSIFIRRGADGLRRAAEDVLGLPVDYHVIINLDIFKGLVDALGGVEVDVPHAMRYVDVAGGLNIDLRPGAQVLDGRGAADFVRYRQTQRGDFDRLDRVKMLAHAMLARLRELHVGAITRLPAVVDTFFDDVETNASPALVRELLPRVPRMRIHAATLPVIELETDSRLLVDRLAVDRFLAETFGGTAHALAEVPAALLQVVNRSGRDGLEERYAERLVAMGVPAEVLLLASAPLDPAPTRLVATSPHWLDAEYYADLLGVGKQQIDRLPNVQGQEIGLQLVLGEDAPEPGAGGTPEQLVALLTIGPGGDP
jgi:polyisoprenyl-teichoic acid--peptidoglycan teichoic acid transferase